MSKWNYTLLMQWCRAFAIAHVDDRDLEGDVAPQPTLVDHTQLQLVEVHCLAVHLARQSDRS